MAAIYGNAVFLFSGIGDPKIRKESQLSYRAYCEADSGEEKKVWRKKDGRARTVPRLVYHSSDKSYHEVSHSYGAHQPRHYKLRRVNSSLLTSEWGLAPNFLLFVVYKPSSSDGCISKTTNFLACTPKYATWGFVFDNEVSKSNKFMTSNL